MTDTDDGDRHDRRDRRGLGGRLLDVLEALAEMEEGRRERSGSTRVGRARIGWDVNIGGLGAGAGRGGRGDRSRRPAHDRERPDEDVDIDLTALEEDPGAEYATDVREVEGGVVVAADLPGVAEERVETELDREAGELLVRVDGEELERVPLAGPSYTITESSFNNGVLELRLEPNGGDEA